MPSYAEHVDNSRAVMIGQRVREARERAGLSQGQLATYADVSRSYITRLEHGEYDDPSYFKLERLAKALDSSVDALVSVPEDGDLEQIAVPREKASAVRRFINMDFGPQPLWDVVEGLVRMFSVDSHKHTLQHHPADQSGGEQQHASC